MLNGKHSTRALLGALREGVRRRCEARVRVAHGRLAALCALVWRLQPASKRRVHAGEAGRIAEDAGRAVTLAALEDVAPADARAVPLAAAAAAAVDAALARGARGLPRALDITLRAAVLLARAAAPRAEAPSDAACAVLDYVRAELDRAAAHAELDPELEVLDAAARLFAQLQDAAANTDARPLVDTLHDMLRDAADIAMVPALYAAAGLVVAARARAPLLPEGSSAIEELADMLDDECACV